MFGFRLGFTAQQEALSDFFFFFFLVQKVPFIIAWGQDPWAKGAALSVSDFLSCFNSLSLDTAPGLRLHVLRQGKV